MFVLPCFQVWNQVICRRSITDFSTGGVQFDRREDKDFDSSSLQVCVFLLLLLLLPVVGAVVDVFIVIVIDCGWHCGCGCNGCHWLSSQCFFALWVACACGCLHLQFHSWIVSISLAGCQDKNKNKLSTAGSTCCCCCRILFGCFYVLVLPSLCLIWLHACMFLCMFSFFV